MSDLDPTTHMHRLHHLSTSTPPLHHLLLLHLLCLTTPSSAPLPPATQAIYTNTHTHVTHTLHTNASARPGASETNRGHRTPACLHTHACMHGHTHLHLNPAALSMSSQNPGTLCPSPCLCIKSAAQVIHRTCLKLPIIQSIPASLQ